MRVCFIVIVCSYHIRPILSPCTVFFPAFLQKPSSLCHLTSCTSKTGLWRSNLDTGQQAWVGSLGIFSFPPLHSKDDDTFRTRHEHSFPCHAFFSLSTILGCTCFPLPLPSTPTLPCHACFSFIPRGMFCFPYLLPLPEHHRLPLNT